MYNTELLMENFEENKEQIKNNIRKFIDNRFIPKFAPKSKDKVCDIIEGKNKINKYWEIILLKDEIGIMIYFYGKVSTEFIQMEIRFPNNNMIDTDLHKNLEKMFDEIIKLSTENKIKRIFKK